MNKVIYKNISTELALHIKNKELQELSYLACITEDMIRPLLDHEEFKEIIDEHPNVNQIKLRYVFIHEILNDCIEFIETHTFSETDTVKLNRSAERLKKNYHLNALKLLILMTRIDRSL